MAIDASRGREFIGVGAGPTPTKLGVRLKLLDGFELRRGGVAVPLSNGPRLLLAFLALRGHSCKRGYVAGVLWSNASEERAAGNLRSALWRLRLVGIQLVKAEYDYLDLAPQVIVDVREAACLAALAFDQASEVAALAFEDFPFTGELLPGWYDDWIVLERERYRQICQQALEALCERWTETGHHAKAVKAGRAAVVSEPLRESAHRALIKAYLAQGNPGEAVRQYARCRQVLQDELQIQPTAEITELLAGLAVTSA